MQHKGRIFSVIVNSDKSDFDYGEVDPSDPVAFVSAELHNRGLRWTVGCCRKQILKGDLLLFRFTNQRLKERRGIYAVGEVEGAPTFDDADDTWWLGFHYLAGPTRHLLRNPLLGPDCARLFPRSFGAPIQQLPADKYGRAEKMLKMSARRSPSERKAPQGTTQPSGWYQDFGAAPKDDPKELQNFARRVRRGQPKFRNMLLRLYGHKCAITGEGPDVVLEAAHLCPHALTGSNASNNGILLRADIHTLFDDGLLAINPSNLKVALDQSLRKTAYWDLNGRTIRPRNTRSRPSTENLRARWKSRHGEPRGSG